jgi:hypothetical protein
MCWPANVSTYVKYVNTFACQKYWCKIDVLRISVSACQKWICGPHLSYINMWHTQMYWHILHMQKHLQVNTYLFKYLKYAKGWLIHMWTYYIHHSLLCAFHHHPPMNFYYSLLLLLLVLSAYSEGPRYAKPPDPLDSTLVTVCPIGYFSPCVASEWYF